MSHQAVSALLLAIMSHVDSQSERVSLTLEALAVHNGWSTLIILLLGDPHLLEGGQRSQDGTTNPDGVLALRRSNDLDLHGRWGESSDFLLHSIGNTGIHGTTTRLE